MKNKKIEIKTSPIDIETMTIGIKGETPLLMERFSDSARESLKNLAEGKGREKRKNRDIINSVTIVVTKNGKSFTSRAFFNVQSGDPNTGSVYVTMNTAMNDDDMRKQLMKQAIDEIKHWSMKYKMFKEFNKLRGEIKKLKV